MPLCSKTVAAASRREFLQKAGLGFGSVAVSSMLQREALLAASPFAPKPQHFPGKAKSVIFLFMHGGPSHIDSFDPKPLLAKLDAQPVPPSFGKVDFQFTNMQKVPIMASRRTFRRRGQSGLEISDLFDNVAEHADDLAVIRSCHHDGFTHVTGQTWMNTGWGRVGRPSVGSWVVYGLGNESENLPAFLVMLDGGIKAGSPAYGSGFLPAMYQGTVLRSEGPPILTVNRPAEIGAGDQRRMLDTLGWFNSRHQETRPGDSELSARMESYELAFKMQSSVPDLVDVSKETAATRKLYGVDEKDTAEFGTQCLMARRMVERGGALYSFTPAARRAAKWAGTAITNAIRTMCTCRAVWTGRSPDCWPI